jgi:hypothetical protein
MPYRSLYETADPEFLKSLIHQPEGSPRLPEINEMLLRKVAGGGRTRLMKDFY